MKKRFFSLMILMLLISSCGSQSNINTNLSLYLPFMSEDNIYLSSFSNNDSKFTFDLPLRFSEKTTILDITSIKLSDKGQVYTGKLIDLINTTNNSYIAKIEVLGDVSHVDKISLKLQNDREYIMPIDVTRLEKSDNNNQRLQFLSFIVPESQYGKFNVTYLFETKEEVTMHLNLYKDFYNPIYNSKLEITPTDPKYKFVTSDDSVEFRTGSYLLSFNFYESFETYYFDENIELKFSTKFQQFQVHSNSTDEICLKELMNYYRY